MSTEKNKISVAMLANNLELNGISTVIMNYCTNLDLKKFSVTLLVGKNIDSGHRQTCERLGIKIVELPYRKKNTLAYLNALNKSMAEGKFDIVHVHGNQAAIALELFIACVNGVKVRIAHSHNTTCVSMKVHKLMKPFFKRVYNHGFACGQQAGEWLFEKRKFTVIPNGFITEKFKFDENLRLQIREELSLQDKLVLGHVGRINDQKNQTYLLKIFKAVAEKDERAVLLMVGTGPMLDEIKQQIEVHPYKDRIILYGETATPEKMYMAMDVFVFPSKYEGLPVTLLEAQISGLSCVVSSSVTDEVVIGRNVEMLSLDKSPDIWATKILAMEKCDRKEFYKDEQQNIEKYEIMNSVKLLENMYRSFLKK